MFIQATPKNTWGFDHGKLRVQVQVLNSPKATEVSSNQSVHGNQFGTPVGLTDTRSGLSVFQLPNQFPGSNSNGVCQFPGRNSNRVYQFPGNGVCWWSTATVGGGTWRTIHVTGFQNGTGLQARARAPGQLQRCLQASRRAWDRPRARRVGLAVKLGVIYFV